MFERLKAGVINMAKTIMNAKQEERNHKFELTKNVTKSVIKGLNADGNRKLRQIGIAVISIGVVMLPIGTAMVINSYIK